MEEILENMRAMNKPSLVRVYLLGVYRMFRPEFDGFSRRGVLFIRSLPDQEVLEAARDNTCAAWKRIERWLGGAHNPSWISARCAETAYMRGVMDAQEMDWICK